MTQKAAQTGADPTGLVAMEQKIFAENARIINDNLAFKILPFGIKADIWWKTVFFSGANILERSEKEFPGLWGSIMCRKRYIDDKVADVANGQINAVVNLGAGFDTRVYRLPALTNVPVWELDQPKNISVKQSRLRKLFKKIPAHVTLVPIDFENEELGAVLKSYNYEAENKTFFIWEAVTQYLTKAANKTIFSFLAKAPKASRLVFTYICKDFISGDIFYGPEDKYAVRNECWVFGMEPEKVAELLRAYDWCVLEHPSCEELTERYIKPTGRRLESISLERIVYAEKL